MFSCLQKQPADGGAQQRQQQAITTNSLPATNDLMSIINVGTQLKTILCCVHNSLICRNRWQQIIQNTNNDTNNGKLGNWHLCRFSSWPHNEHFIYAGIERMSSGRSMGHDASSVVSSNLDRTINIWSTFLHSTDIKEQRASANSTIYKLISLLN
ncbi:unnamed protein product [Ceratitis capitata]|uniref:(Mediterranean fruit fly) hypothetical protein n=1 Tax=Ceratitis capitata TaxID=7213 RepID=A0A811U0F9_CERCA|nr:unnamed protein product [Ceratitis capitata]